MKKNIIIALGLLALVSCSSIDKTGLLKKEVKVKFVKSNNFDDKLYEQKEGKEKYLDLLSAKNFEFTGDFLYKGEKIAIDKEISPELKILYAFSKKVNDKNLVFIKIQDKFGKTKDIELNQEVSEKDLPQVKDGIRYKELKKNSNNRIKYSVITMDNSEEEKKDYSKYYKFDKYEDLDDLTANKRAYVRTYTNGDFGNISKVNVDFGEKLVDYKDNLDELLTNLSKTTLKFSKDGKKIEGGFNTDLVKKIEAKENVKFVTEILDEDKQSIGIHNISRKIIKDGVVIFEKKEKTYVAFSGTTVGVTDSTFYEVSPEVEARMIRYTPKNLDYSPKKNPELQGLFREHGTTVIGSMIDEIALGDGDWFNKLQVLYIPKQLVRQGAKGNLKIEFDIKKELTYNELSNLVLNISQRSLTAASTIQKNTNRVTDEKLDQLIKELLVLQKYNMKMGVVDKLLKLTDTSKVTSTIENEAGTYLAFISKGELEENEKDKIKEEFKKFVNEKYTELKALNDEKRKENINEGYKSIYEDLLRCYEEYFNITEVDNLKQTDLHFATVSMGDKDNGKLRRDPSKYVAKMLEENKNIKAINMSYGAEQSYYEYESIKNMTQEEKQKAVDEYNKNEEFRTAVKIWLASNDYGHMETYQKESAGTLGIPSVLKYFESRNKITVADYQKLLDLRMLELKAALNHNKELVNTNSDVLFVVSAGNTKNNEGKTDVDLSRFNQDGSKVLYLDPDKKYSQNLVDVPLYLNDLEKDKAKKEGKKYKYNPSYRKNLLSVVGLTNNFLRKNSTDNISEEWGLITFSGAPALEKKEYAVFMHERLEQLEKILSDIEDNPSKYSEKYKNEIKAQINTINNLSIIDKNHPIDPDGRLSNFSFARAGKAKLWTVASEGWYVYNKKLTKEDKKYNPDDTKDVNAFLNNDYVGSNFNNIGSSFAAPRITAIAGVLSTKFPWLTAQQIKQVILTTATDDYRMKVDAKTKKLIGIVGKYGPDDVIGWGIVNKYKAYLGLARLTRALTIETGNEDFIANIPYGTYEFSNDIQGAFDPYLYASSRKESNLSQIEGIILQNISKFDPSYVMSKQFDNDNPKIIEILSKINQTKEDIYSDMYPKFEKYMSTLEDYEKDMFVDAGLVKKGKGTLILSGDNKYKDPTVVEEGTLILRGSSTSPILIHKDAKLKLDMKYLEIIKNATKQKETDPDYNSSITADVINYGSLYSYSTSDRIKATYAPKKDSKTYIASFGHLDIDNLDLSETNEFDFDIFRKKGSSIFNLNYDEDGKIKNEDIYRKTVLTINKLSKKDEYKITFGTRAISPYVDLLIEKEEIANDNDNIKVKATLIKKEINPQSMETVNKIMAELKGKKDKSSIEKICSLSMLNENDEEKIKAKSLANSERLGYEIVDLKNNKILERLNIKGNVDKFNIYFDLMNQNKFDLESNITINGFNLGFERNSKYNRFGVAFNYTNSVLFDYNKKQKKLATALGNNFGLSLYDKFEYNKGYVSLILGFDYLNKKIEREKDNYLNSSDIIMNLNLEGGYKFVLPKNVSIEPFVGTNLLGYVRGSFDENIEFGYKADREKYLKANMTIGTRVRAQITDSWNLGGFISYTKYLTDPTLKLKATLKEYDFKNTIKGISLEDNYIKYGFDARKKIKNNMEIQISYMGKNIKTQGLGLGFKYEF